MKIVQFTHPGAEHQPDTKNAGFKSWNTTNKKHQRKFLLTNGLYLTREGPKQGRLVCWGEWEPPSRVSRLDNHRNKHLARWLHEPILPNNNTRKNELGLQNTDPFIFGNCFKYFLCKQLRRGGIATQCARLEQGDLILFGSTSGRLSQSAFFQLDTVFVVSHYIDYDPSDIDALDRADVPKDYFELVIKKAFPTPAHHSTSLRLYFGATYESQINGMYSFTPARLYSGENSGFERIRLTANDLEFISNNLNAANKFTTTTEAETFEAWEALRKISNRSGCVEGIYFDYERS